MLMTREETANCGAVVITCLLRRPEGQKHIAVLLGAESASVILPPAASKKPFFDSRTIQAEAGKSRHNA